MPPAGAIDPKFLMSQTSPAQRVAITKNGPFLVSGGLPLSEQWIVVNKEGESLEYREGTKYATSAEYALCRCGQSNNKPFCDGSHAKCSFDGTETASRQPYAEQAEVIEGQAMLLTDVQNLCAFARFCDPKGRVWNLVQQPDSPETRQLVKHEAGHCPAGRLIAWDKKSGKAFEPEFEPSIALIEDTAKKVSGPIWVRGGVPIVSADGETYEVRNRATLCRCGRSSNKPFCDGSHAA